MSNVQADPLAQLFDEAMSTIAAAAAGSYFQPDAEDELRDACRRRLDEINDRAKHCSEIPHVA